MILPSIKKQENIDWLLANEQTFLDYMAKHHSHYDIAHTYLHYETFDDEYVENMIVTIQKEDARKEKEEKKRKASEKKQIKAEKKSKEEQKIEEMTKKTAPRQAVLPD